MCSEMCVREIRERRRHVYSMLGRATSSLNKRYPKRIRIRSEGDMDHMGGSDTGRSRGGKRSLPRLITLLMEDNNNTCRDIRMRVTCTFDRGRPEEESSSSGFSCKFT
jgi:hypothetical protein